MSMQGATLTSEEQQRCAKAPVDTHTPEAHRRAHEITYTQRDLHKPSLWTVESILTASLLLLLLSSSLRFEAMQSHNEGVFMNVYKGALTHE